MRRRLGPLARASSVWLIAGLLACSSNRPESSKGPEGVAGGGGGRGGDIGNPDQDGGPILTGDAGFVCPPDSEECVRPGMDAGLIDPPLDSGAPPDADRPDAEPPDPDATVPEDAGRDASEPDGDVIIPDDGGAPTAATYEIDLLFVVDNSGSMRDEQLALRNQFPMLISRLLASTAIGGGADVVPGAQDIHLGVVSTDLGAPGVPGIEGCVGVGDNGWLNRYASADAVGCSAEPYPRFLSYVAGTHDPAQVAEDLGCIASLGIDGCGFEQQLESMLKAVWPGDDGRITFVTDVDGTYGTGQSGAAFPNGDFVRLESGDEDVSVLAIVVVTDEEDCSSNSMTHLVPAHLLPADDPRVLQGLNVRCYFEGLQPEPNALYDVARYVDGLRALRPGYEQRVVFGAIVGVPTELVTEAALEAVDFGDASERDAHYAAILDHAEMQYRLDERDNAYPEDDLLMPSCVTPTGSALAYPPRRIVEVARGFGERGFVQSICADDWSPAMELLATRIAQARAE